MYAPFLKWARTPRLWTPGPEVKTEGPVIVSFTDLTVHRFRDIIACAASGLSLRKGWYAMPGAVGLWLWSSPLERRSGSISVWTNEDDLLRFVRLPRHLAIMREHRKCGTLRSAKFTAERFVAADILRRGRQLITHPALDLA